MPKRSATSPDGSRSKKSRGGSSGKRRKPRTPVPCEPLRLTVSKWRWSDDDIHPIVSSSTHQVHEAGPTTWSRVLANYCANSHAIHDVTFQTNDAKLLPAHSLVLRIRVPFFATLLAGKPNPGGGENVRCLMINIDWTDSETLQTIIEIVYLKKTAKDVADEQLFKVFAAAMHLSWEELETGCYEQFQERLQTRNCLEWLEWSVTSENMLVKLRAAQFAAAHLEALREEREQELARLSLDAHLALVRLR